MLRDQSDAILALKTCHKTLMHYTGEDRPQLEAMLKSRAEDALKRRSDFLAELAKKYRWKIGPDSTWSLIYKTCELFAGAGPEVCEEVETNDRNANSVG